MKLVGRDGEGDGNIFLTPCWLTFSSLLRSERNKMEVSSDTFLKINGHNLQKIIFTSTHY